MIAFSSSTELIHSPARLDQVLTAVRDAHVPFGVDRGNVTGAEPAVVGKLVRARWLIVVACGDDRAANLQFANGSAVPRLRAVFSHDAQLDQGNRESLAGANLILLLGRQACVLRFEPAKRTDRGQFGHAPAMLDR